MAFTSRRTGLVFARRRASETGEDRPVAYVGVSAACRTRQDTTELRCELEGHRRGSGTPHEPAQGPSDASTRVCNSARWRHWGTCRARGVPGPSPRRRVRGWCRWLASSRRNWATLRSYGRPVYWRVMSVPTASRRVIAESGKAGTRCRSGRFWRVTSYGPTRIEYYLEIGDPEFARRWPKCWELYTMLVQLSRAAEGCPHGPVDGLCFL